MEASGRPPRHAVGGRSSQPPTTLRSLVSSRPLHGSRLAEHRQPRTALLQSPTPKKAFHMERSGEVDDGVAERSEAISASRPDDLAVLGKPHSASGVALHTQTRAARLTGRITTTNVLRLLELQQYRCALTGRPLTPETASLDHIVPVRCGGEHAIENAQVLHKDVNRAKTTMTSEEFICLCREVVAHADSHNLSNSETRRSA